MYSQNNGRGYTTLVLQQEELSEIEKSRYNKKYKYIRTTELPEYMKRPGKNNKHKIIARFRTGNEEEENKYWLKDRKRCRVCGEGEDSVEHMVNECMMDKNWTWRAVLEEDGRGERWMREVKTRRKKETEVD